MAKYAPKILKAGFLPKLLLVCFITVVLHDTFWVIWTIDKFRAEYREAAQTRTMEEVEIAYSVITRWHDFESAGTLSRTEAQASALAERSSVATKEIAVLVGGIQGTVREAVNAMHRGSQEIENGCNLATDAGASLDVILEGSRVASKQVGRISNTASQVTELSSQVVAAIEEISRVVEENAASTEQMTENSRSVSNAVGDSSSIAEQNGAAAQEVSASVEEMSAQVEETLAGAHSLSGMSEEMERTVVVFKVN